MNRTRRAKTGTNHFSWILSIRDRRTEEDLYPLFRKRFFELDPKFEPLTRDVFDAFGWFPVPGDTHLCEYLPWVSDPVTKPWEKNNIRLYDWELMAAARDFLHNLLNEWHVATFLWRNCVTRTRKARSK